MKFSGYKKILFSLFAMLALIAMKLFNRLSDEVFGILYGLIFALYLVIEGWLDLRGIKLRIGNLLIDGKQEKDNDNTE